MADFFGKPHYELLERTGHHEELIGRYATEAEALSEGALRDRIWTKMRLTHGELIVRYREF